MRAYSLVGGSRRKGPYPALIFVIRERGPQGRVEESGRVGDLASRIRHLGSGRAGGGSCILHLGCGSGGRFLAPGSLFLVFKKRRADEGPSWSSFNGRPSRASVANSSMNSARVSTPSSGMAL